MFNRSEFANSRPDGFPVLEIARPGPAPHDQPRLFVPLQRSELRGAITGPLASLRLKQVFAFTRESLDQVIEAVYRFPLPGDAAVLGVDIAFGDVEIHALLKERTTAEAEYEQAKHQGRQAALLTRESPDVFTLQVAGIHPDQPVTVETCYVQLVRAETEGWSLRIPLTTAPRYTRSDESGSRHAQGQPLYLMRDPGHRFSLDLTLQGTDAVNSITHALEAEPVQDGVKVRLKDGEVMPDRDCVLTWQPAQVDDQATLQAWRYDDETARQTYFLGLVAPPRQTPPDHLIPREIILLVDRSGSMGGPKGEAAAWTVKNFLGGLTDRDTFSVCMFDDKQVWFNYGPHQATSQKVKEAQAFVDQHPPRGGTELGVALEQGLRMTRHRETDGRHLLIITDAEVSDEGRILQLAEAERRQAQRRRISVICIDAAPNAFLAHELAERGGGVARFLTSQPDEEDITTALENVLADWNAPVLTGLTLNVDRPGALSGQGIARPGPTPGWSTFELGDLPTGRAVWIVGRVPLDARDLTLRLDAEQQPGVAELHLPTLTPSAVGPAIKALFGARRVVALEFLMHQGRDQRALRDQLERLGYVADDVLSATTDQSPAVYLENAREAIVKALRSTLVREALDYGLASAETAFVAVRQEAGQPVETTALVGNALPMGWSEEFSPMMFMTSRAGKFSMSSPASRSAYAPRAMRDASAPADLNQVMTASGSVGASAQSGAWTQAQDHLPVFSGVPAFANGEAVLVDTADPKHARRLRRLMRLTRLHMALLDPALTAERVDPGLTLALYVDDMIAPRVTVRLASLLRQGSERPLNISINPGTRVRLVLLDPSGVWVNEAPRLEVKLL